MVLKQVELAATGDKTVAAPALVAGNATDDIISLLVQREADRERKRKRRAVRTRALPSARDPPDTPRRRRR
jgi:hypothetical protein